MKPALFVNNKIVTGGNHGEAFSKLSNEEKDAKIKSGFLDGLKFISDEEVIYLKEIILLRHAESNNEENGAITENGKWQACILGKFLNKLNLDHFKGFCSPYARCLQTSEILNNICTIQFKEDNRLSKCCEEESSFNERILKFLDFLPKKAIVITHTDFIQNLLVLTNLFKERLQPIKNCSITYIYQNRLIWAARAVNDKEN